MSQEEVLITTVLIRVDSKAREVMAKFLNLRAFPLHRIQMPPHTIEDHLFMII